ncbi:protein PAT1 homolog 2 [Sphaerodactylus townsendi]|uniref:protein PAT1 homolog 2 n=1 Tax=Sphaerodactylus townsendi TaxID=933632 RepID=UPI002025EFCE|nr:protein PAT1 homolog 2 [Sphaerodactylus townsendi]
MAEEGGVGPVILEDYFMSDEEILLDKTPEDDEIDLYNNMTFTSSAYQDESEVKTLAADSEEAPVNGFEEPAAPGEEAGPSEMAEEQLMLEDVSEDESRHSEPQLADEAAEETEEEEMETAEQEEDHTSEEAEEQNDLGDPAVIRAVRGRFAFEPREDSAVLERRIASSLPDYTSDFLVNHFEAASKPDWWNSALRRASTRSVMEGFYRGPITGTPWTSLFPALAGNLHRRRFCAIQPGSCGRTLKPSSQRFMRPQSPMMPGSMRSPYPFTPPRRTRRVFSLNRTSGYTSPSVRPLFPNINSPTWSLSRSFDPLLFSPSANSQQKFSLPSAMTQLHPLHQRILTQRQKRGRERRIPCMDPQPPEMDPYAALMTTLEKDWVIKVQMMQLQSESPQRDDYYYQEYYRKLEHKKAQKELLGGCKLEVPKLTTPYIRKVETYESVVRIPGSLGQVAVSTCYSPRRAIDAVHHIPPEQAVGNQRLQVLYQIEKMFLQLLDIEDTQRKLVLAPEKQHSHFYEKLAHELGHIYQSLRIEECNNEEETKGTFLQILLVGKGKKLVARLLPHLSPEQAKQVLITITQNLSFLIKKDLLDETLPVLYSPLGEVVEQLTFSEMVDILQELSRLQPDSVNQSLATIFGNKFAVSLLYLLLSHGERCLSSGMPLEPQSGDFEKWVDTVLLVARELSQVSKESMVEPLHMPSNLLFLFCRYVDKETVNRLDVKME